MSNVHESDEPEPGIRYTHTQVRQYANKAVKNCVLDLVGDIPENQRKILNLGPKFAVTPKSIPYMEIVTTTEIEALKLEKKGESAKAELLRQEVKKILMKEKKPKSNLSREQLRTISEIKKDENIDIYPYDKGNGFVRMSKETARTKMIEGIGETIILDKDPTKSHLDKIQKTLAKIRKERNLPKDLYYKLYPSDATVPRAYGQCKAHKPTKNYPFRILVSTIGTAPYKVSKYLVKIIQPTLVKNPVVVKNTKEFVEEAKNWDIGPNEIQVSYDVVALYPSVPVKKAINNLMDMLQDDYEDFKTRTILELKHVKQLLEVCLDKSYFLWNKQIHSLKDSGPIGLSLMVVLAESYLQMIEKKSLTIARSRTVPVNPITHKRYVDDSHDRFLSKETSEEFLSILNAQDERIQYTAEYETTNEEENKSELNYLEITTINNKTGKYQFKVYRKQAITNIQIKPDSCHDNRIKEGVFKGYIRRAKAICSEEHLSEEIEFIKQIFRENGYDEARLNKLIIETERKRNKNNETQNKAYTSLPWIPGLSQKLKKVFKKAECTISFKSPRNLESILTSKNKPEMPTNCQPGVYFVPTGCRKGYTGETKKQILTRNNEHEKAIFKNDQADAIAEHHDKCGCEIDLTMTKTVAVEPAWYRRKVREALEIRRLKTGPEEETGINRDLGDYVTTNTWSSLFTKINRSKDIPTFNSMMPNNRANGSMTSNN